MTVIVPVRDESANIAGCLQSLLTQRYPAARFDVVVVDDESTDDTPFVVQSLAQKNAQVRLLRSPALPQGATGKAHACWMGARAAARYAIGRPGMSISPLERCFRSQNVRESDLV